MEKKRHSDAAESSNSKRIQTNTPTSILGYFKKHHTYQDFNSKDLLLLLNCETPETAKQEAISQMNRILDAKKLKNEVRVFVSRLLIDNLQCLSDSNADMYWAEKKSMAALIASSHKQLQVYHGVSSGVMNQALYNQTASLSPISEETDPLRGLSPSGETESWPENIWSLWSDVLNRMLTEEHNDKDLNKYSLEYLGIITLGSHMGNKQSRDMYPRELVSQTNKAMEVDVVDVFKKFASFYAPLFEALANSKDQCHDLLLKNCLKVKKTAEASLQFVCDFFMIFVTQIIGKQGVLSRQESIYNYRAIFRFFDAVVSAVPSCVFFPGETRLKAISKELELQEMSKKSYYNADGIIFDSDTGLELCLLETSGPLGLIDVLRETTDQIKAAYGLLAMLHTIARKFKHADIQTYKKLKVCFVHAAKDKIRLWSFCLVEKNLYVLSRMDSALVPTVNDEEFKGKFMRLVNFFWKLKMLLDDAKISLDNLKASHDKNEASYRDGHIDELKCLDSYLVEDVEIKLSSRVSQASSIYVSSSPIRPDSQ